MINVDEDDLVFGVRIGDRAAEPLKEVTLYDTASRIIE
jgi:hypothetical protein